MTYRPTSPEASQPAVSAGAAGKDFQSPPSFSSSSSSLQSSAESSSDSETNPELRQLKRALRAFSSCNRALAHGANEQQLLDEICDLMVRIAGYRMAGIAFAEQDERKTVRPVAHAGFVSAYLTDIDVRWSDTPAGRGPAGIAIRENRVCVIADTAKDENFAPWREAAAQRGFAAMIALPLRVGGTAFGVLAIYSEQAGSFEGAEVELLSEIADSRAYGIMALRAQAENRWATAALREAEAKYRQLVEMVPAISYVAEAGAHGRFLYVNPQAETILGYRPEDCLTDPAFWWKHLHPDDHAIAIQEDTWEEGRPFQVEYRMYRQDGREVWLRDDAVIVRDRDTGRRLTRGLLIDITERKRAEAALRESEARYRMFLAQSSEGIYRLEYAPPVPCDLPIDEQLALGLKNGYIAECNDAMAKLYGRNGAEELIGKRLSEILVLNDPMTREFMEHFIRSGYRITDQESREVDAHGQKKILRSTMMGTVIDGHWARTWGISRDVTARVHLEEQLRNAQQLEAVGRLAGSVAHDFNNILSIIMGHGELMLANTTADAEARNGLEQIRKAAERAAALTQQLLAFSRKQVLQPKVMDLNEAVAEVQKMLTRVIGEDIELVASLHPALASVRVDPGQVEQVLMNLTINARDAMPHGGKIAMETANVDVDAVRACELELTAGKYVLLQVSDTGHGMDAATMGHLFEPFFTTKKLGKGTGLGLATVYGIVRQSGGCIEVYSEPGKGSTFKIYLPEHRGGVAAKAAAATPTPAHAPRTATILVVEDDEGIREMIHDILTPGGYQVLLAANPRQALTLAENHPH